MSMDDPTEFLNHLFIHTSGFFELTYIDPQGHYGLDPHIRCESYKLGYQVPDWDRVDHFNRRGYSVYYGLTTKKRALPHVRARSSERDTLTLGCLWCEVDLKGGVYATHEDIYRALCDFVEPPTVIINSGGGLHALWRITPVTVTKENHAFIKEILRGLALTIKGDTSVAETARVFRLPGTINTKSERNGARCELIDLLPGEYSLEDFTPYRALARPVAKPIDRDLPRYKPDTLPQCVEDYLNQSISEGGRNNALNAAAFVLHSNDFSQSEAEGILLSKALSDGLSEREALRTIQSAYDAPKGTPSYIDRNTGDRMRAGDALKGLSEE
jgi:hypothetical protein